MHVGLQLALLAVLERHIVLGKARAPLPVLQQEEANLRAGESARPAPSASAAARTARVRVERRSAFRAPSVLALRRCLAPGSGATPAGRPPKRPRVWFALQTVAVRTGCDRPRRRAWGLFATSAAASPCPALPPFPVLFGATRTLSAALWQVSCGLSSSRSHCLALAGKQLRGKQRARRCSAACAEGGAMPGDGQPPRTREELEQEEEALCETLQAAEDLLQCVPTVHCHVVKHPCRRRSARMRGTAPAQGEAVAAGVSERGAWRHERGTARPAPLRSTLSCHPTRRVGSTCHARATTWEPAPWGACSMT